jgi:glycine hydroxymethyltransferase
MMTLHGLKSNDFGRGTKKMKTSDVRATYDRLFTLLEKHHSWMRETINLIASENVHSPAVREAIGVDFGDRYAEGWPGDRVYAGCNTR